MDGTCLRRNPRRARRAESLPEERREPRGPLAEFTIHPSVLEQIRLLSSRSPLKVGLLLLELRLVSPENEELRPRLLSVDSA